VLHDRATTAPTREHDAWLLDLFQNNFGAIARGWW